MMTPTITHRITMRQAQQIAASAWQNRETEPVQSFKRWELATNLLKLGWLASQVTTDTTKGAA